MSKSHNSNSYFCINKKNLENEYNRIDNSNSEDKYIGINKYNSISNNKISNYTNIIGTEYSSKIGDYIIAYDNLNNKDDLKFILPNIPKKVDDPKYYLENSYFHYERKQYTNNSRYKCIILNDLLNDVLKRNNMIIRNIKNIDIEFYPRLEVSSYSTQLYLDIINMSNDFKMFSFKVTKLDMRNIVENGIKPQLKSFISDSINILKYIQTDEFYNYILFCKNIYSLIKEDKMGIKAEHQILTLKNAIDFSEIVNLKVDNNNFQSWFESNISNNNINDNIKTLYDKIKNIRNICNQQKTYHNINNKYCDIKVYKTQTNYEILGLLFKSDIIHITSLQKYLTILVLLGFFNEINNKFEKTILLKS